MPLTITNPTTQIELEQNIITNLFNHQDYHYYCSTKDTWQVSETTLQLCYLCEQHIADGAKYLHDQETLAIILDKIESLIDDCEQLSKAILNRNYVRCFKNSIYIAEIIMEAINIHLTVMDCSYILSDSQRRVLKLLDRICIKEPKVANALYLNQSKSVWQVAVQNNDLETLRPFIRYSSSHRRNKIFEFALQQPQLSVVRAVLDIDQACGCTSRERILKKLGAWPLLPANLSTQATNDLPKNNANIDAIVAAIAHHFPIDDSSSSFGMLFPFTNEYDHDKVIEQMRIVTNLQQERAIAGSDDGITNVALLIGESSVFSMLDQLAKLVKIVILADDEPRQLTHLKHMLACLEKAETPWQYIDYYLTDNPILNEPLISGTADIHWLTRHIKESDSTHRAYFLSSMANFLACKKAAKEVRFIQIKLDLMNEEKCQLLADTLTKNKAKISFCNLTNVHHYDEYNKLAVSIPRLLPKANTCLVMYGAGERHQLHATVSIGLKEYFKHALHRKYVPPTPNCDTATSPLVSRGLFSSSDSKVPFQTTPLSNAMSFRL